MALQQVFLFLSIYLGKCSHVKQRLKIVARTAIKFSASLIKSHYVDNNDASSGQNLGIVRRIDISFAKVSIVTTPTSTLKAPLCRDDPHCKDLEINEEKCQKDPSIMKSCVQSCTRCTCKDADICRTLPLSPLYCRYSEFARENCLESCQLCLRSNNVNKNQSMKAIPYQIKELQSFIDCVSI